LSNTTGTSNTATGFNALVFNAGGGYNTADGLDALYSNTTGGDNTANGAGALGGNTTGNDNTAIGFDALVFNTTGVNNIALGSQAGVELTTGNNNIDIGNFGIGGDDSTIRIGTLFHQSATFIAGIYKANEGPSFISAVYIDNNGQLGTQPPPSSRRFKKEIKPMDKVSEAILALKPVTFQYKSDNNGTPQFGLIAEEVAQVKPDLVLRDAEGKVYSVRYEAVNAMLLNEFLKEHRKVQQLESKTQDQERKAEKQEAMIAKQQEQIEVLTAAVEKVSDRLELSKPAPQLVADNQ
jgi:hypothetical protein